MRFLGKFLFYLLLGLFSFVFFLYLSFPYQILKERMVNTVSRETKSLVSVGSFGPSFPLGIFLEDIRVYRPGVGELRIKSLTADVSLFSLLLGGLSVYVHIEDATQGSLEVFTKLSLSEVLSDPEEVLPSHTAIDAKRFDIAPIINYFLRSKAADKGMNPVVKSALRDMLFVGKLNSKSFVTLDSSDYLNSKAKIDLTLVESGMDILSLPYQQFEKAVFKANLDKGAFQIDPTTSLVSEGLKVEASGHAKQAEDVFDSKMDITLKIQLFKALKENFSMILDFFSSSASDGATRLKIKGTLGDPKVDF